MNSHCVEIQNLEFGYGNQEVAPLLQVPAFNIKRADKVFLFGESGSGKSTLLNILSGVLSPTKGSVKVCGADLTQLSARARDHLRGQKLGVIFQQFNLVNYLTALENIKLPALFHHLPHAHERARELGEKLGLTKVMNQKAATLSLGEQQRVAAARAMLGRPELIIADEPTSSLDGPNSERFMKGLFELALENQTAILFVSHDTRLKSHFERSVGMSELKSGVAQ